MALVFALAVAIWALGAFMGLGRSLRWAMIALLLVAVIGITAVFPEGHGLRMALGGTPAPYLLLLGGAGIVWLYAAVLRRVKARAFVQSAPEVPAQTATFSPVELDRYARHIVLREVGGPGQKRLKQAKVLVIGAGGLGAPVLQYLAAAGVGTIGVIDDDVVENANLQRQVIHTDADIGIPKVFSAQQKMEAQNPHVTVRPYHRRLSDEIAPALFADYDLVLDGTDNFDTRYMVNRAAVAAGIPLISGAMSQWEGQLSVFDPARAAPCYRCVFPEKPAPGLAPSCSEAGVIGPLPGVIGAMMAQEAIKLITGAGAVLRGEMVIYDGLYGETRKLGLTRRGDCPDCAAIKETKA